jgi:hypothetical protein
VNNTQEGQIAGIHDAAYTFKDDFIRNIPHKVVFDLRGGTLRMNPARTNRRLIWGLAAAAFSAMNSGVALAESPPDVSSTESVARYLTAQCRGWRVVDSAPRQALVLIGRPSGSVCGEVVRQASQRAVEAAKEGAQKAKWALHLALAGVCRDVAGKLAGRSVDHPFCQTWGHLQEGGGVTAASVTPPDEMWSHGLSAPLREFLERRLDRDWDQLHVKKELQTAGFDCMPPTPSAASLVCWVGVAEIDGMQSTPPFRPTFWMMLIDVKRAWIGVGGWQVTGIKATF